MGVTGSILKWVELFLVGRTAQVKVKNFVPHPFDILSGIPQGSYLDPMLFNVVEVIFHSKLLSYTDDAKLFKNIKLSKDAEELQMDINAMALWCRNNALDKNISKCNVINFYENRNTSLYSYMINNEFVSVELTKYLGVVIDQILNFRKHFDYICTKALKTIVFLRNTIDEFSNCSMILYLYNSMVMPNILSYAAPFIVYIR